MNLENNASTSLNTNNTKTHTNYQDNILGFYGNIFLLESEKYAKSNSTPKSQSQSNSRSTSKFKSFPKTTPDSLNDSLYNNDSQSVSSSTTQFTSISPKDKFSRRFPHLNIDYYTTITKRLLSRMYPKFCPNCEVELTLEINCNEKKVLCPKCFYQGSRTAYTPLHHLKLPLWVFSYILIESIQLYPAVLSGQGIKRRIGVTSNTACFLKRRLQLFLSEFMPRIKELMKEDILKDFKDVKLPENMDLTADIAGKAIVHADTVALFSATQRSNGGMKRHKHTGQTASIYLTDEVAKEKGKYQIGTLTHTMGIKQGAVILDSIPDQKERTIKPLFDFLPKDAPVFTDDGYPWLKRYNQNHKAVNHSARAIDKKRNVWSRNRWSKDGVNNQVAEGFQRILKHSFISGYSYISPKYSQLYLN